MKKINRFVKIMLLFFISIFVFNSISYPLNDRNALRPPLVNKKRIEAINLMEKANQLIKEADNVKILRELIKTYEDVLIEDPDNYQAFWSLGRYYMLMGMAYSDTVSDKRAYYEKTIMICEKAMNTNKAFRDRVEGGDSIVQAAETLTVDEIASMYYWYTAHGLIFIECLSRIDKVRYFPIIRRNKKMLKNMIKIDPTWAGGHPYCALANTYALAPRILGGNPSKAMFYYEKAIEEGPKWLYIRYSRSLLFHKLKDKVRFKEDLKWILEQDPHEADSPFPWNVFFQREAKKLMGDIDKLFKDKNRIHVKIVNTLRTLLKFL